MKRIVPVFSLLVVAILAAVVGWSANPAADGENWPQWRGPQATGATATGNPPVE